MNYRSLSKAATRLGTLWLLALLFLTTKHALAQTYTWTATGNLNTARDYHAASVLADGRVLVAGGLDPSDNPINSAEIYDPSTGLWTATGNLNTARSRHTASVMADGRILVAGGLGTSGPFNSAEIYDPSTGLWTATGNLNTARLYHTASVLADGRVLVAGGYGASGFINSAEIYDPSTGLWTATGNLNTARDYHTASVLADGRVLVAGGLQALFNPTNSAEIYDPSTGLWTATGNLNTARHVHTASVLADGRVLVAGGLGTSDPFNSAEIYDPSTGLWTATGNLNTARDYHTASVLADGRVLAAGGRGVFDPTNSAEIYDPSTGLWTATGNLDTARYLHTANVLADGRVLVAGGYGASGFINSAEIFDGPSSATPVMPGAAGGNGPGGVGVTDGSSSLDAWYRSDRGVFNDISCLVPANDTTPTVGCWADQSGSGNNGTQNNSGTQPTYATNVLNGQPGLQFDGLDDVINLPNATVPTGDSPYSIFAIVNADTMGSRGILGSGNYGSLNQVNAFRFDGGSFLWNYWWGNDLRTANSSVQTNTNYAFSFVYAPGSRAIFINGGLGNMDMVSGRNGGNGNNTIGKTWGTEFWDGAIDEIIIFSSSLNNTERILVENYLSAKYNVALNTGNGAMDVYDGDVDDVNHNFDLDMAGIGQYGGNQHTQAHSVGLIVVNRSFLQDNGDWLTFGHRTATSANTNADVPTGGDWDGINDQRWTRHWYFDRTDIGTVGETVDIIFDFSEAGMTGSPVAPASNYRLLRRADGVTQFSDIATATAIVGDQVQFLNVDVTQLGSNFTLGTLDAANSPTAVSLQSFSAAHPPTGLATLLLIMIVLLTALVGLKRAKLPYSAT